MKIKGTLPKGDADGITAIESVALKKQKPIVALVILEPAKIDQDLHTQEKELTVGIRRIEAVLPEDVEAVTRFIQRSFESRTGESTLPIELENDVKEALKGVENYVPETQPHGSGESLVGPPEGGYSTMKVAELRDRLKSRGLDHSQGTKTELIGRLEEADAATSETPTTNVVSLFADGSDPVPVDDVDDAEWEAAAPEPGDLPAEYTDDDAPEPDEA